MTTLDDFFSKPADFLHPRLRNWKSRLGEAGTSATLELFRPETDLGQAEAEMNVQFTKNGTLLPLETVPWDDDLNAGLIELHVRAANLEEEAERFALGLRAALRKASREFGDGFFNAVLLEFLTDSDLTTHPPIDAVLEHAHALQPNRSGTGYDTCREMIANAMRGRARELTGPLGYPQAEAKQILVAALARYLDERFSVSSRRRLGLL
jgi:hypothetical protein